MNSKTHKAMWFYLKANVEGLVDNMNKGDNLGVDSTRALAVLATLSGLLELIKRLEDCSDEEFKERINGNYKKEKKEDGYSH